MGMGYGVGAFWLLFLGAVSSWIAQEYDFRKMFWIGLSAPALFAAAIPPASTGHIDPNIKTGWFHNLSPIGVAEASETERQCVGDTPFVKGVKIFFGVEPPPAEKFSVIAGSYKDPRIAQEKAKAINNENPTLKARVGIRACSSEYFPVVVGDALPPDEARKVMTKTLKLDAVEDAYLSPGPR
jgi:hypothetical protein